MSKELITGFTLGLAYAAPIGAQNLFVVSQALRLGSPRNLLLAAIVATMDISLAIACMLGAGSILDRHAVIRALVGTLGGLYLGYIAYDGLCTFRSSSELSIQKTAFPWRTIVFKAFLLTWLNPHAIIDGTAILGTYSAGLSETSRSTFMFGVAFASLTWFIALSIVSSLFSGNRGQVFVKSIKFMSSLTIVFFALSILNTSIHDWMNI